MATSYEIANGVVFVRLVGKYTPDDIKDTMHQALADADFPAEALVLMDVTASESLAERDPADVRDMAGFLARLSPRFGARLGIAAGSGLEYGMMRMAEVYSETSGMTARAFQTVDEALAWLTAETSNP